jgi:3'-phosphoadenosine 5'-phosphosulfate sulfotransferase (PAPS reductase)/FAD synthetase
MESECEKHNIPFVRIRPRKTWEELFYTVSEAGYIWGFPTRGARWCNSKYKLDAKKQMIEYMKSLGKDVIWYIGYCANEADRINKRIGRKEIYPLAEKGIEENIILEWAKTVDIFNNYYLSNRRCGCMYCPLASRISQAYLYKYYPEQWNYLLEKMRETERINCERYSREKFSCISGNPKYNADYLEHIIKTKWIYKLEEIEKEKEV